jgi:hypothetical protein
VPFWTSWGLAFGCKGFCARCGDFLGRVGLRDAGVRPFALSLNWSSHSPRSMLLSSRCSLSYLSSSALICSVIS